MTEKFKKRIMVPLFFIVLSGIIVFNVVRITSGNTDKNRVKAYKVQGGWGYTISHNGKVFIEQSFIPVIQGKKPFPDRKSAVKTGNLVLERIEQGTLPHLTIEDLKELGLAE